MTVKLWRGCLQAALNKQLRRGSQFHSHLRWGELRFARQVSVVRIRKSEQRAGK
jgi:hypothetical protein